MLKKILLSTLIIIVLICLGGGLYLYRLVNPDIVEHFAGTCVFFELNGSGEDVQIDRARGFAHVSLFDRQGLVKGDPVVPGDILRFDMTRIPLEAVSAIADGPELRPYGISLFVDQAGHDSKVSRGWLVPRRVVLPLFTEPAPQGRRQATREQC